MNTPIDHSTNPFTIDDVPTEAVENNEREEDEGEEDDGGGMIELSTTKGDSHNNDVENHTTTNNNTVEPAGMGGGGIMLLSSPERLEAAERLLRGEDGVLTQEAGTTTNARSSLHEDVHSLPTLSQMKGRRQTDNDDSDEYGQGGSSFPLTVFTILFMLLIAVSVGIGVGLSTKSTRSDWDWNSGSGSGSSSGSGGGGKTLYEDNGRFRSIVDYLVNYDVSEWNDVLKTGSPQNLAAQWLAFEDETVPFVPMVSLASRSGYHFVTRYVLTLIYFSMGGDDWSHGMNFKTSQHYCDWFEVIIEEYRMLPRGVGCNENQLIDALFLDSSNVVGVIPSELGLLTTLRVINFDVNGIRGQLPSSLRKLTTLEHASVAHNVLTGTFPSWIDGLISLQTMDLSYNFMDGTLPISLRNVPSLEGLALDFNHFHGRIDNIFGSYITSGAKEMDVPDSRSGLTALGVLYLEDNSFSGTFDDLFMTGMTDLRRLDLSGNQFDGTLPRHFFQMPSLEILDLHDNNIYGAIPLDLPENTVLKFLALHQNSIQGPIPTKILNLQKLRHLDVANNLLTHIPTEIGALTNLEYLFLASNQFIPGPIPTVLGQLTKLEDLSLKSTHRTGILPHDLFDRDGGLHRLVLLDLDDNQIQGTIPTVMASMVNLQFLLLNANNLTNTIPTEFANMFSLRLLFIDENDLIGSLDPIFCDRPDTPQSFVPYIIADCASPEVEVECDCCFRCCASHTPCNDDDIVPSHDPMWQFGYERVFYVFGDRTAFFAYP